MKLFLSLSLMFVLLTGCQVAGSQELADQADLRFEGVRSIQVKGVFCDVSVKPGNSAEVHLLGEIRVTRGVEDYSIETTQDGDLLKVWVEYPKIMRGMAKGFLSFEVPDDVLLTVENVSGNVDVEKIGSDNMKLSGVSGDISVSGAGENCVLRSVSGDIDALVMGGNLEAHSVSGDIRVANVKGDFSGKSTSGNVSAKMVEGATSVRSTSGDLIAENLMQGAFVKTTSGKIQVKIMKGELNCETVSGDVILSDITGVLNASTVSGGLRGTGVMFTGDSRFRSVSGDVEIDVLNEIETLSFRLKSGSGRLKAGNSTADERLEISGGNITVTGSSTSGNQIFE
ncbi:DUF4097 family beta strand repeat-containing protein [Marinilabilia sp.]|uniref:DUF4097 family beta strand repeat-containing protein n=1 Tax=Marinilabilia sp. TaxID=2021252 RepID=UPI0025B8C53F|nr:DUF4097 family beta strand repeat-containing protein [Marinilabilia sp.]